MPTRRADTPDRRRGQPTGGVPGDGAGSISSVTQVRGRAGDQLADAGRPLTRWTASQAATLTSSVVRTRHRLGDLDLFGDDALARLLDAHPRRDLQIFTMGTDPTHDDWAPVDAGSASGSEMLAAVAAGRLWLNVLHVERADDGFSRLQDELFEEVTAAGLDVLPGTPHSTLLVSSPDAMVYFHADAGPNILWHVRGDKRVWVYPPGNESFVDRRLLEDIYVGVRTEFLPYEPEFDDAALLFDLHPGDALAWPQNSPHRVQNLGVVNVSLTCEFDTPGSRRRHLVYAANRFFSRKWHLPVRSTQVTGTGAAFKRLAYRASRKMGLERDHPPHEHVTSLRIDASAPNGVTPLAEPTRASFSVG
jgi:Cupin-like domain